jgi:pantoate--beta-alanine ligase
VSVLVVPTRAELREALAGKGRVALVPTMGALHEGHASLMREARGRTDGPVVASVFVNPLQFGAGEDLDRYPRTLEQDLKVCEREGVDLVFAPAVEEVYPGWPAQPQVTVEPGPLATLFEGRTRPGHFRGVLTVVAKLFGLVRPDLAVFGQKDYQQLVLVRRMVEDLCLGVEVVGAETQREPDGLALSSRNRYLSADERARAAVLSRALRRAQAAAAYGAESALGEARAELRAVDGVDLDYLELTDPDLGELAPDATGEARILVAAKVGTTRLIDNLPLTLGRA